MAHCSNIIATAVFFAPKIVQRNQVASFCSFLPVLERFFLVLFKTHLAIVVIASECMLSTWKAKVRRLAQEVNALGLIHWKFKPPLTIMHCHVHQSIWIPELNSFVKPRQ